MTKPNTDRVKYTLEFRLEAVRVVEMGFTLAAANCLLAHLRERHSGYTSIEVALNADFESEQGERFFDQMTDNLQMNMDVIAQILRIPIKVSTDAVY